MEENKSPVFFICLFFFVQPLRLSRKWLLGQLLLLLVLRFSEPVQVCPQSGQLPSG